MSKDARINIPAIPMRANIQGNEIFLAKTDLLRWLAEIEIALLKADLYD